jgi:hypothetical protein
MLSKTKQVARSTSIQRAAESEGSRKLSVHRKSRGLIALVGVSYVPATFALTETFSITTRRSKSWASGQHGHYSVCLSSVSTIMVDYPLKDPLL